MSTTLSLDISASSTGWCLLSESSIEYGTINTSANLSRSERLVEFTAGLALIFQSEGVCVDNIVIEDVFSGINVKTLKMLAEFSGVAKYYCQYFNGIDPYVISTNTVKSYFKVHKKEELFRFLSDILDKNNLTFKKDNDIIDSIGQAMCYRDLVLGETFYREEMEYGFLYKGGIIC